MHKAQWLQSYLRQLCFLQFSFLTGLIRRSFRSPTISRWPPVCCLYLTARRLLRCLHSVATSVLLLHALSKSAVDRAYRIAFKAQYTGKGIGNHNREAWSSMGIYEFVSCSTIVTNLAKANCRLLPNEIKRTGLNNSPRVVLVHLHYHIKLSKWILCMTKEERFTNPHIPTSLTGVTFNQYLEIKPDANATKTKKLYNQCGSRKVGQNKLNNCPILIVHISTPRFLEQSDSGRPHNIYAADFDSDPHFSTSLTNHNSHLLDSTRVGSKDQPQ